MIGERWLNLALLAALVAVPLVAQAMACGRGGNIPCGQHAVPAGRRLAGNRNAPASERFSWWHCPTKQTATGLPAPAPLARPFYPRRLKGDSAVARLALATPQGYPLFLITLLLKV